MTKSDEIVIASSLYAAWGAARAEAFWGLSRMKALACENRGRRIPGGLFKNRALYGLLMT